MIACPACRQFYINTYNDVLVDVLDDVTRQKPRQGKRTSAVQHTNIALERAASSVGNMLSCRLIRTHTLIMLTATCSVSWPHCCSVAIPRQGYVTVCGLRAGQSWGSKRQHSHCRSQHMQRHALAGSHLAAATVCRPRSGRHHHQRQARCRMSPPQHGPG